MNKTYTVAATYYDTYDLITECFTVEAEDEEDAKALVCSLIINEMNYPFVTSLQIKGDEMKHRYKSIECVDAIQYQDSDECRKAIAEMKAEADEIRDKSVSIYISYDDPKRPILKILCIDYVIDYVQGFGEGDYVLMTADGTLLPLLKDDFENKYVRDE